MVSAQNASPSTFGERAVPKLMSAALTRTAERWRGLRMTSFEHDQSKVDALECTHGLAGDAQCCYCTLIPFIRQMI
jgi:hypothetical protein